jgi:membrane-associated protein
MTPTLNQIFYLLSYYKYVIIFPLAVVEGPIVTILCGFLASLGKLNFWLVWLIVALGDIFGDSALYFLGIYGRTSLATKVLKFLGITKEHVVFIEDKFKKHPKKILSISKISHGVGSIALLAAGVVRFSYKKFLLYTVVLTIIKSLILTSIGFYFGRAYSNINKYFDIGAVVIIIIFVVLYFVFIRYLNTYVKNENLNSDR